MSASGLHSRHCTAIAQGTPALNASQAENLLHQLHRDWQLDDSAHTLSRDFRFGNFHQTMAFVNALAWIAHREDHHPELEVGYRHCRVHFSTHSIGGLSENDFICAAQLDALLPAGA